MTARHLPTVFFASCLAVLIGLTQVTTALAQTVPADTAPVGADAITLTAIPPRVGDTGEIRIKPGQKFQTTIRVFNGSSKDLNVETFAKDFIIGTDGTTPVPVTETTNNRWSLASWIVLTPSSQVVASKKTAIINVLIEVPKNAMPGGRYAMLLHQPSAPGANKDEVSGSGVNQQVGSLLYVVVDGPINEEAFIRDFVFKPNIAEFGPMHFFYGIDNQSDVHVRPSGLVEIYNIFHQKVAEVVVEPNNVFPGSLRNFTGVWPVNWGFGPYKAVLTVSYGTHGQVLTAESTVWLLPLSIIIALIILLLALITGGMVIKRQLKKRGRQTMTSSASESSQLPPQPNQPAD
jgi:hypothetical protein